MNIQAIFESKIKAASNLHRPSNSNVMIFSTPRSGSTWLMELIWSQPQFKTCNEPLNIRNSNVQKAFGLKTWEELYDENNREKILEYFSAINEGKYGALNPNPFRKHYKPITSRIVYKIINGGELWINELAAVSNSKVIYLIRHPFAVALSRKVLPRLDVLCSDKILAHFNAEIRQLARTIQSTGSKLERAVLSWCLQNKLALDNRREHWLIVAYEQLLVEPEPIISLLSDQLNLPKPYRMRKALCTPSAVTVQSQKGTVDMIKSGNWESMINSWKMKISPAEQERLWVIIKGFDLQIYDPENAGVLPGYGH